MKILGKIKVGLAVLSVASLVCMTSCGGKKNTITLKQVEKASGGTVLDKDIFRSLYNYETVNSIIIGDGITAIDRSTFDDCKSLVNIKIPESVISIGDFAFYKCESLKSITIPKNVVSIGENAFDSCASLTEVTISEGVTSIGEYAFRDCESLVSIVIPKTVTTIGQAAFDNCKSLASVVIPEGVNTIGKYAFYKCDLLASVTIPESVNFIGDIAFYCESLTEVIVKNPIPPEMDSAFGHSWEAENLKKICVPAASVEAYKTAKGWEEYADKIEAIK